MITQRAETPDAERQRGVLWDPEVEGFEPKPTDVYIVVDEQDEGVLVVVGARWPELDSLGRVFFRDEEVVDRQIEQETFEAASSSARTRRRPIRIGDVFLVRGLPAVTFAEFANAMASREVTQWGTFIDVTAAAREAAKAALLAAAAPKLTRQRARLIEETSPETPEEPPTSGQIAGPVV